MIGKSLASPLASQDVISAVDFWNQSHADSTTLNFCCGSTETRQEQVFCTLVDWLISIVTCKGGGEEENEEEESYNSSLFETSIGLYRWMSCIVDLKGQLKTS